MFLNSGGSQTFPLTFHDRMPAKLLFHQPLMDLANVSKQTRKTTLNMFVPDSSELENVGPGTVGSREFFDSDAA